MNRKPKHLMISGYGDCDDHRMSARGRGEEYAHVPETAEVAASLPYDIVYVDSSPVYRAPDYRAVDVRSERLKWVYETARAHPATLFVIVKDRELEPGWVRGREGWADLLADWLGRELPNIYFQEPSPMRQAGDTWDIRDFLAAPVRAWEALTRSTI